MKWMRYLKEEPDTCFFKYELEDSVEFKRIKLVGEKRPNEQPLPLYKGKLPISNAKKKDLLSLCKQGAIPSEFHE